MSEDQTRTGSRNRREARTMALKVLFEGDLTQHGAESVLQRYLEDESIAEEQRTFAARLISGILDHRAGIDDQIGRAAPAFPVEQLAAVDRNVLRIAIYELQHERDVPMKAAINEAVEIAKQFGGENSGRFVNGVLGTIASDIAAAEGQEG